MSLHSHSLNSVQPIFTATERLINLKLELAITIDVGEHFVKATYFLEGDGLLVLSCYEKLHAVFFFLTNSMLLPEPAKPPHFPNVNAVAVAIAEENPAQNVSALEQQAKACVQPAIDWFLRKFNVPPYNRVSASSGWSQLSNQ